MPFNFYKNDFTYFNFYENDFVYYALEDVDFVRISAWNICPYVVYFYYYNCQTKNSILFNQITDKVRNVKLSPLVN